MLMHVLCMLQRTTFGVRRFLDGLGDYFRARRLCGAVGHDDLTAEGFQSRSGLGVSILGCALTEDDRPRRRYAERQRHGKQANARRLSGRLACTTLSGPGTLQAIFRSSFDSARHRQTSAGTDT